ncbi:MAG: phosphatase PAP2 family protein [Jatrophihabitans sp.]
MGSSGASESPPTRRVSWRAWAFVGAFVLYVALTLCVIYKTPVLSLDSYLKGLDLRQRLPASWKNWISVYIAFGQRGPSTLVFLPFFLWTAWRRRSPQPLVLLVTALILLNGSVGIVKVITGRLGPLRTHNTHAIFDGGNIYPSGHVSNAVVLYGLMAWIAIAHRRWFVAGAIWLSVTVGIGTIYLDTHWFSDVVGGWVAGGLVLLALPWVMPFAERLTDATIARIRSAPHLRRRARGLPGGSPAQGPARPTAGARTALVRTSGGTLHAFQKRPKHAQPNSTPVRSVARSQQSFAAAAASFDAPDEPTRFGDPRTSPIPSGP